ncbi:hypothetical protein AMTR_s00028p00185730 [Amborella trichopoda]|uniref:Uncharacterized protein n=1 Tax=Amborella trichopoda TaxID=13333 RepID=W1PSD9_AMBTC|nr:hypothetical protein AMTR_s00028p00185730 [Amborella trichopoda]
MRAVVREPDAVRELLTNASFFAREGPFPIGGPSNGIFINDFCLALDMAVTKTWEARYLASVRGCILSFWGLGCKRLKGYFLRRFASRHGLDQGCYAAISFFKKYGKKGALRDPEAPSASREV